MFKKIVVAFITKQFKNRSFLTGLDIAQKFEGSVTVIDCVYKKPSKFVFLKLVVIKNHTLKPKKKFQKILKNLKRLQMRKIS